MKTFRRLHTRSIGCNSPRRATLDDNTLMTIVANSTILLFTLLLIADRNQNDFRLVLGRGKKKSQWKFEIQCYL